MGSKQNLRYLCKQQTRSSFLLHSKKGRVHHPKPHLLEITHYDDNNNYYDTPRRVYSRARYCVVLVGATLY